jgi:hypothetical protein
MMPWPGFHPPCIGIGPDLKLDVLLWKRLLDGEAYGSLRLEVATM